MTPLLEIRDLMMGYGVSEVLKGVSMKVYPGEIVTLLGANGAGKSTTLLTVAGVYQPRGGDLVWRGKSYLEKTSDEILKMGICLCPEGRHIFPHLSVLENLKIGAYVVDTKNEQKKLNEIYEYFPILKERRNQLGGTLSGGEQQMLAIGRALMSEADLLMLDEPSLGLAPIITQRIFKILEEISKQGKTIFLVEQNAQQALRIAKRGYVMVMGKIAFEGTSENLLASDQVKKAYLGGV